MGKSTYKKYMYVGPVEEFGRCVAHNWTSTTYAPSEKKARSNFIFQFKKNTNRLPTTKITLPGKIVVVNERSQHNGLSSELSSG